MVLVPDVRTREGRIDVALWIATAVCAVITIVLSLVVVPIDSVPFPGADKVQHAVAYLITSLLLFLAAVWRPGRGDGPLVTWGVWLPVVLIAAGGIVELIQSRIGREAEFADWAAEILAVTLAYVIVVTLRKRHAVA